MCGRYYIDDETAREIEKIVKNLDNRLKQTANQGDVYPTNPAMVLGQEQNTPVLDAMQWGFPQYQRKGVIFNARSETVLEKRTFSSSAMQRRCLIPAKGFYEWDQSKNKVSFERPDGQVMLMAGIWNYFETVPKFVILTTQANETMAPVHDRMPLIIEPEELETWLYQESGMKELLHKKPISLSRVAGYVQESLPLM
ncbi:MAG: SOS response-associated peptidase [Lachnospiraceae bacterium]|nr:SOS response-associated peptidase [Lachnospiraceae bacterium]